VRAGTERRLEEVLYPSASLSRGEVSGTKAIILAGGKGTRLKPYTSVLPKPLLPLGDRAILELVLHQLAQKGFVDITLSVGHLAHLIEAVFGDGDGHGVDITYVREDVPLGTAGSLRLVEGLEDTFLVLNGDLVTTLDYRDVLRTHQASNNLLTIATRQRQVKIEYGVIDVEAGTERMQRVVHYQEKPVFDFMVSMGIYVMEPETLDFIPAGSYFDIPDLVQELLSVDAPVGALGHDGLWLDVGNHDDYEQAVVLCEEGKLASLWAGVGPPAAALSPQAPA
jgi:NDP-sugar pyrophosphorylase family protein